MNASPIDITATGFEDDTVDEQVHYAYFIFTVNSDNSMAVANPVWATTWTNADAAQAIYQSIINRIGGTLSTWRQMPYIVNPKDTDTSRRKKAFGLLMNADNLADSSALGSYDKDQKYTILLSDVVLSGTKDDSQLISVVNNLSTAMEQVSIDLAKNKCGVPALVVTAARANPEGGPGILSGRRVGLPSWRNNSSVPNQSLRSRSWQTALF